MPEDQLTGLIRDYHQEFKILTHEVDLMKQAIKQLAEEAGVTLKVSI